MGVVGCKVLDANDNIYSSGYEITWSQAKEEKDYNSVNDDEEESEIERYIDVVARYREYNGNYKLANRDTIVSGVAEGMKNKKIN